MQHVAVIDIGKTNAKVAVVDLATQAEIAVRKTTNAVLASGLYPHYDIGRLWAFITQSLERLGREVGIDAISVVTHGATAALVRADGELALPVPDYEHTGPDDLAADYDGVRPPFGETGSPRLPIGLNLGAQLFWQAREFPDEFDAATAILMWPQYWAWRLTGAMASEATSLGCHTDLWNPLGRTYSSLVDRMGWAAKFPPLKGAGEVLGTLKPELAASLGLSPDTPVLTGIHDSNASLYPHLLGRAAPFSVVSTGTWVVALSVGGVATALDETRDCLINVNALGDPVASARFMGGREFALTVERDMVSPSAAFLRFVLRDRTMLLPSVVQGSGPFPNHASRWTAPEEHIQGDTRFAALSLYLAMMTATCLDLTGAAGPVIVEGPFARNEAYLAMLQAILERPVFAGEGATGTSIGAALLAAPGIVPELALAEVAPHDEADAMRAYFDAWKAAVAG